MAKERNAARSLDLLSASVARVLKLGDAVGKDTGRVGVLRERLEGAQSKLDAYHKRRPPDKRVVERQADKVLSALVEYLTALIAESKRKA